MHRTAVDEAMAARGVIPPGEAAPRQLAALLRIEDQNTQIIALLTEMRDGMAGAATPAPTPKKTPRGA